MEEEYKFSFRKSANTTSFNYNDEDAVIGLKIIKSGWGSPDLYHCILEYGEYGDIDYKLFTKEEIKEKYNIEI